LLTHHIFLLNVKKVFVGFSAFPWRPYGRVLGGGSAANSSHLKAIPVFDRLEDNELGKVYEICTFSKFQADEVIYKFGAASDDLFILLDGQLVAKSKAGIDIAYISPIGIVGEMGVLTDQPRSADVVALEEAVGFVITK